MSQHKLKFSKKSLLAFVVSGLLLAFAAGELVVRLIFPPYQFSIETEKEYIEGDRDLVFHLAKNTSTEVWRMREGKEVFRVNYDTDVQRRRVTLPTRQSPQSDYVIFIGSSPTFGEGLRNDETLPSYFARKTSKVNVYNYAVSGYMPQHHLEWARKRDIEDEVIGKNGYIFYSLHLNRSRSYIQMANETFGVPVTNWLEYSLHHHMNDNGKLIRQGVLKKEHPLLLKVYNFFQGSELINYSYPFWHPVSKKELETLLQYLSEIKKHLAKKLPGAEFIVFIHPFSDNKISERFKPMMEEKRISFYDFSSSSISDPGDNLLLYSWPSPHPNAKFNKELAELLSLKAKYLKR